MARTGLIYALTESTGRTSSGVLLAQSRARLATPQEIADMEREAAESERRAAEREAKLTAARAQLAAITDPLARAVLDLHCENTYGECVGDDFDGWEAESPPWPCITVVTIAKHYGIDIGDQR